MKKSTKNHPSIQQKPPHLTSGFTKTITKTKQQVAPNTRPNFRGANNKYNEFEHLLLNHNQPAVNKITEEDKFHVFQKSITRRGHKLLADDHYYSHDHTNECPPDVQEGVRQRRYARSRQIQVE